VRAGTDFTLDDNETRVAKRTAYENNETRSKYAQSWGKSFENNFDFLLSYKNNLFDNKLSVVATGGGNYRHNWGNSIGFYALALSLDNLYTVGNAKNVTSSQGFSQMQVQSLYGTVSLGYKSYLFLDLTAREDWNSTLYSKIDPASSDLEYFYPSASLSTLVTDAFPALKTDLLSYLKVRLAIAGIGNGTTAYRTSYNYSIGPGHLGQQYAYKPDVKPFVTLKPELVNTGEVGVEANFFQNLLKLDATYYINRTSNQIIAQRIPSPSGYTSKLMNAGLVQNQGVEIQLTANIINKKS
ncbi:TonB-dependent receptor, partial [bacterium]|nr:TonB-dependent receptor [bacterium]